MGRQLRIVINVQRLRENLSKEQGRELSHQDVARWLREAGFQFDGHLWVADEGDLMKLDDDEIVSLEGGA